jgi:hypothetical protein
VNPGHGPEPVPAAAAHAADPATAGQPRRPAGGQPGCDGPGSPLDALARRFARAGDGLTFRLSVDGGRDRRWLLAARDAVTAALRHMGVRVDLTDDGTDVWLWWPADAQPADFDAYEPVPPVTEDALAAALDRLGVSYPHGDAALLANHLAAALRGDL